MARVMRKVKKVRRFRADHTPAGGGTNVLNLECGHDLYRKASIPVPERAWCKECQSWKDGETGRKIVGGFWETWDPEVELPVWRSVDDEPGEES